MTRSLPTQPQSVFAGLSDSVGAAGVVAEILLAVAVFGLLTYAAWSVESVGTFTIVPPKAPLQSSWHPDGSEYCSWVHQLNGNVLDGNVLLAEFIVMGMANSAPTAQAHNAAVALYKDVANLNPTTNDVNAVVAASPCPASSAP